MNSVHRTYMSKVKNFLYERENGGPWGVRCMVTIPLGKKKKTPHKSRKAWQVCVILD